MPPKKKSTDVQVARGRLKGALKDIVGESDESSDESDPSIPQRGRPPKRHKTEKAALHQQREADRQQQIVMQNTYIMKLFDRSVDLAKYNENTSLYPICRAWMLNQPRSTAITNFRLKRTPSPETREPLDNMLDDLKSGQITIVNSMPSINYADINVTRVPSQLSFHKELSKDNIDLDYNLDKPKISKDDIMIEMKKRWTSVRKNWHKKVKDYQEKKYGKSMRVIEEIGKNII